MNKPVNYELAKLLKEKGFNELCSSYYLKSDIEPIETNVKYSNNRIAYSCCTAPTIAEVVMWIYEKYDIWIWVAQEFTDSFDFSYRFRNKEGFTPPIGSFKKPTEAYEAAIEYCLNNLIN